MEPSALDAIIRLTARERLLIASSRGAAMDESPDKLAALADAVRALDRLGAPHAVVGGVAVGIRSGVPRATVDTDIAVRSTIDRAEPLDITGVRIRVVTTVDLIAMKERSKALRDQADIALLRGDIPDPDEGW